MARFLEQEENILTKPLFSLCFPDEEFLKEHYGRDGEGLGCRTAAAEMDGSIVSMAQLVRRTAVYSESELPVWYIMGVCTHPDYRHRGLMDEVLSLVLEQFSREGEEYCFLMPVDPEIYRHLGFIHDFHVRTKEELDLLYADDGLSLCSAREFREGAFREPMHIKR